MLFKTTNRLFKGIYQYKIVLVVSGASLFRSGDMAATLKELQKISEDFTNQPKYNSIKTKDDLDYALKLQKQVSKLQDFELRVETPFVSIYSNNWNDINGLSKLDQDRVKYISKPADNTTLSAETIIMPKVNFEFRITLGKTTSEHSAFVEWAKTNKKIKLTKSCVRDLSKDRSWGGTHFYITGDNNLLMAKMHLGSSINKVERIIKA